MVAMFVVVALAVSAGLLFAQDTAGFINVKDFGAKGDGSTDDTEAIRAAFAAVKYYGVQAGSYQNSFSSNPVLFPPGAYRITDSIRIGDQGVITGVGMPSIVMEDPGKDIFTTTGAWRLNIRGFQFRGGRTQLALRNPNLDTGMVVIEDCRFYDSGGPAIDDHMRSTIVHIRNCHFLLCEQALHARTDMVAMRDCWITSKWGVSDKAVIENYTHLLLENICGVPLVGGRNLRWVDNYGELIVKNMRFGGEGGGFTPVYNYAKPGKELAGGKILIDHSLVYSLGNPAAPTAVYCIEIPNKIEIRSSTLAGVKPIIVDEKIDLKTYFTGVDPELLSYTSRDNIGTFRNDIPELLKNPVCPPEEKEAGLSDDEVATRLAAAVEKVKALTTEDASPYTFEGRVQKTNPEDYIELSPQKYQWDLDDCMDGVKTKNSHYLAMAPAGDDVVIMKRVAGQYPHVLIRNVKADLDKTPWLTWKQKDVGTPEGFAVNPAGYAVRVIHKESGAGVLLTEMHWRPFFDYRAYNLKEKFGIEGGVHTFDIRFYYLGLNFVSSEKAETARPGDYIAIDFLRLEKE